MSMQHVLLGLLSQSPMSGYDMKKIIADTPYLYWSGNNNQIYKALMALQAEGYAEKAVEHQDGAPSKHIYTITELGRRALREWLLSHTEAPAMRNQMLIKLSLSQALHGEDVRDMLVRYERVVRMQAELTQRALHVSEAIGFEAQPFAALIRDNMRALYEQELAFIAQAKIIANTLPQSDASELIAEETQHEQGEWNMEKRIIERSGKHILHLQTAGALFEREADGLDMVSLCMEHDTFVVLAEGEALSEAFITLRTGVAGTILQKCENYRMHLAAVVKPGQAYPERFREMIGEHGAGSTFRVYTSAEDAIAWLCEVE